MDRMGIEPIKNRLQGGPVPQLGHGPIAENASRRFLYSFNDLVDELCAMNDLHVLLRLRRNSTV